MNGGYGLTLMSVNHTNTFLRENATEKGKYLSLSFMYEGSGYCRGKIPEHNLCQSFIVNIYIFSVFSVNYSHKREKNYVHVYHS